MSAVCWQVELNFISHRPFLKCSEGAEIWSPVGRGPISVSRGAQDLPEYLVGGKDSDPAEFQLWDFSVQLCQKEWTERAKSVHSCTMWMVSSSVWTWMCPPSPLCWLQHTQNGLLSVASQATSQLRFGLAFWASFASPYSCACLLSCFSSALEKNSSGLTSVNPKEIHWFTQPLPSSQTEHLPECWKACCRFSSSRLSEYWATGYRI